MIKKFKVENLLKNILFILIGSIYGCSNINSVHYNKDEESFYIFGVGQGNAQLAAYRDKFGVLYDCGSSSQSIHPKLCEFKRNWVDEKLWSPVFLKKSKKNLKRKQPIIASSQARYKQGERIVDSREEYEEDAEILDQEEQEDPEYSEMSKFSFGEDSISNCWGNDKNDQIISDNTKAEHKSSKDFIKKIINSNDLEHLFVILSHPDKDHINYINSDTIPDDLNITVFLEAQWLLRLQNEPVREVLEFLLERDSSITTIEFPHYWDGLLSRKVHQPKLVDYFNKNQGENKAIKINHQDILDSLLADFNKSKSDKTPLSFSLTKEKIVDCEVIHRERDATVPIRAQSLKEYVEWRKYSHSHKKYLDDLENIKIVHSWFYGKDFDIKASKKIVNDKDDSKDPTNHQSAIVQITMPEIKMHIFLTGDAEGKTLEKVRDENYFDSNLKNSKKFEKNEGFFSLVMLPHHGAREDDKGKIISSKQILLDYFDADVFGISAGNGYGGKFKHPSHTLIKEFRGITEAYTFQHLEEKINEGSIEENFNGIGNECYNSSFYDFFECTDQINSLSCFDPDKSYVMPSHVWSYARECNDNLNEEIPHENCDEAGFPFLCTNVMGSIKIDSYGIYVPFTNYAMDTDGRVYMIDYTRRAKYNQTNDTLSFSVTSGKLRSGESMDSSTLRSGTPYKKLKGIVVFKKRDLQDVSLVNNTSKLTLQRSPDMLGDAVCKLVLKINKTKEDVYYRAVIYDNRQAEPANQMNRLNEDDGIWNESEEE